MNHPAKQILLLLVYSHRRRVPFGGGIVVELPDGPPIVVVPIERRGRRFRVLRVDVVNVLTISVRWTGNASKCKSGVRDRQERKR